MKTKLLLVAACAGLSLLSLTSCSAPANGSAPTDNGAGAAVAQGFSNWWNSPANQSAVAAIEQAAANAAVTAITHLGATNQTQEQKIQKQISKLMAEYPKAPRSDLEKVVRQEFRKAARHKSP